MLRANRPPSPSERRMDELCALRRPLSECEIDEVRHLRVMIRKAAAKRRLYALNADYRRAEIERNTRYWREHR